MQRLERERAADRTASDKSGDRKNFAVQRLALFTAWRGDDTVNCIVERALAVAGQRLPYDGPRALVRYGDLGQGLDEPVRDRCDRCGIRVPVRVPAITRAR